MKSFKLSDLPAFQGLGLVTWLSLPISEVCSDRPVNPHDCGGHINWRFKTTRGITEL